MSRFDWHPRHHRAALDGMRCLTLEEKGAYNTLLDLMYERGGPVPDDQRWLAGWMGCSLRKWTSLRAALIVKGKIVAEDTPHGPVLSNPRAADELASQQFRSDFAAEIGAKGGRKRAENARRAKENSELAQAKSNHKTKTREDTPVVPQGDEPRQLELVPDEPPVEAPSLRQLVTDIWNETPKPGRERSSIAELEDALTAARKRGADLAAVRRALAAYYRTDAATKDGGQYAKGVHRMVQRDRWANFQPAAPAPVDTSTWRPERWTVAVRNWVEERRWPDGAGPKPGEPGCKAPAEVLARFGFGKGEAA